MPELDPESPARWRNVVTRHVDGVLNQPGSNAECQAQRNYFIREVMKALSHSEQLVSLIVPKLLVFTNDMTPTKSRTSLLFSPADTPIRAGDKAWRGSSLVVVEKIDAGITFVRPAAIVGQPQSAEATTEPLFAGKQSKTLLVCNWV